MSEIHTLFGSLALVEAAPDQVGHRGCPRSGQGGDRGEPARADAHDPVATHQFATVLPETTSPSARRSARIRGAP
jgi:hypothetical protein